MFGNIFYKVTKVADPDFLTEPSLVDKCSRMAFFGFVINAFRITKSALATFASLGVRNVRLGLE